VRWTSDSRDLDGKTTLSFGPDDVPIPFKEDEDFSEPTWRVALDYNVSDDMMIYASYNRGFKSGVYNTIVSSGVPTPPVDPEIVDAYEVGMKSEWFNSRMRANLAVFYYDYQDIQLQFVNAGATILGNASDAEIYGSELELFGNVTENLSLRFGAAYLDTEYKQYANAPISTPSDAGFGPIGGNVVSFGDVSGNEMARAPKYTTSFGANYSLAVGDNMMFGASLNWYYNDGFYWFEDNRVKEDAYDVVNAELSLASADERWKVRVWAKNLTDEEYSIFTNTGQFGDLAAFAPPRVVGAGVEYRFF
jgi:iron complex outermembrane recepter protein